MRLECTECPLQQRCQEKIIEEYAEAQDLHLRFTDQTTSNQELAGTAGKSLQEMVRIRNELEALLEQSLSIDDRVLATNELERANEFIALMLSTSDASLDRILDYQKYREIVDEQTNTLVSNYLELSRMLEATCNGPRRRKKYFIFGKTIVKCTSPAAEHVSLDDDAAAETLTAAVDNS
jgi:hypothetical protein